MNSKLIKASMAGVAAIAVAAGGTTFAAWSDFANVNGNQTAAGHLQLELGNGAVISNVGGTAIAPGESRTIDFFVASADLDGVPLADLSMKFINLDDEENGCATNSEAAAESVAPTPPSNCGVDTAGLDNSGEFADEAYVRIRYSDPAPVGAITSTSNSCTAPSGYVNSRHYAPASNNNSEVYPKLAALVVDGDQALGQLAADEGVCIRIDLGLPESATNASQGDVSKFDLQFDLVQS